MVKHDIINFRRSDTSSVENCPKWLDGSQQIKNIWHAYQEDNVTIARKLSAQGTLVGLPLELPQADIAMGKIEI